MVSLAERLPLRGSPTCSMRAYVWRVLQRLGIREADAGSRAEVFVVVRQLPIERAPR
jgi:hypothetical protein